jgi:prevent-host-death family protein
VHVSEITIRDLRNHGGEVVDRVLRGEHLTVTRSGKAVAELRPLARAAVPAELLLARWRALPAIDPGTLRRDIDATLDAGR